MVNYFNIVTWMKVPVARMRKLRVIQLYTGHAVNFKLMPSFNCFPENSLSSTTSVAVGMKEPDTFYTLVQTHKNKKKNEQRK